MIYVNESELQQVEYLIFQSIRGHHVLFEPEAVRTAFRDWEHRPFTEKDAYSVEPHIEKLLSMPTLIQKRAYLEKLDAETYQLLIRTYFNIVENNIFENLEVTH